MSIFERFRKKEATPEQKESERLKSILKDMARIYMHRTGIWHDGYPEGEDKAEYDALNSKIQNFEANKPLLQELETYLNENSFDRVEEEMFGRYMRMILKGLKEKGAF